MARTWFGGRRRTGDNARRRRPDSDAQRRMHVFHHRLRLEPLEDRRMLSVCGFPELPGMVLVDPVPDQFEGQVIYLDFDGAENVTYNGPIVVDGVDIPRFQSPYRLTGEESAIIPEIVAGLRTTFDGTGIIFTTSKPVDGIECSTVFIGGDNAAFSEYGDFLGLSETVDINNRNRADKAFVFADELGSFDSVCLAANAIADTIEHEVGHLIGYAHASSPQESLNDFAYSGTVYWAARHFWATANHHFMVISFSGSTPAWSEIQTLYDGSKALLVGGFEIGGKLTTDYFNGDDLEATNDWFAGANTHGWDPEFHDIGLPSGLDFDDFSTVLYELTKSYDNQVDYVLGVYPDYAQNCATYVNTVMAKAGVPENVRIEEGEFSGTDWGEENILESGHFSYVTGIASSDGSVAKGTDFTLTATTAATDAVANVNFYWDANANGVLDLYNDVMLGSDYGSSDGWGLDISTDDLAVGTHWFFAHAWDSQADYSKNYWRIQVTITPPNDPPVAEAGGPYSVNEGSTITLSASGSYDPDGYIASYHWDLDNDGQYDDASGQTTSFSRTSDGAYTVRVKVTDNGGAYATDSATVTVYNVAPTAHAGGSYSVSEGSTITLSAAGSTDPGQDISSYLWDLDNDGQYDDASGVTTTFRRTADGSYTVRVKVSDNDGAYDTASATVTVNNVAPTADAGGPYVYTHQLVLDASASNDPGDDIASYAWDLDNDGQYDDAFSSATDEYHPTAVGTFPVRVKVTDDDGAWTVDTAQVTVPGSPTSRTYVVDSLADVVAVDGVTTLREALEASNTNTTVGDALAGSVLEIDVIAFDPTLFLSGPVTITLAGSQLEISDFLDIQGPGAELLTIDANEQSRVFYVEEDVTATIDGLAITGGSDDYVSAGGGIFNSGTLTVTNSTISGNSVSEVGGAICNYLGALSVTNTTISGNSASEGGGICNIGGMLTIMNSIVLDNLAFWDGGGLYNEAGTLIVTNATISGNLAGGVAGRGGGIYNSGTLTVSNSTILGNSTGDSWWDGCGGGVYNSGMLTVINTSISSNSASDDGGGIYDSGTLRVTNSTISGNSASYGGGVCISDSPSTATLNNTIVAGNRVAGDGDVLSPDLCCSSGALSAANNLIGDGSGQSTLFDGVNGNLVGTSDSPIDPLLSDWTLSDSGRWTYYLLPGSPALDAGDNSLALDAAGQPLTDDSLGGPRIQNGTVDIGAVEGAWVGNSAQTYTVTSLENIIASDGVLTFLEAFEAANRNQPVGDATAGSFSGEDTIQFTAALHGTIEVSDGELAIVGRLSIEGPGAELLTFDGQGQNRIIFVQLTGRATLRGITITGGSSEGGGGICNEGMLTVADSTISGNSCPAEYYSGFPGGGIYNKGTLTVTNSTISGNSAPGGRGGGGGICNETTLTVTNSIISGNSAESGGGLFNSGTATITDSTISGNSGGGEYGGGGGISNWGTLTITNTTISGNSSIDSFGGIDNGGTLTITNSTISGNSANYCGGVYNGGSGTLTISNSTISGNSAMYAGGIRNGGTLTITNSVLSGNSASFTGGGIVNEGTLTVTNSTISGNSAGGQGGGIYSEAYDENWDLVPGPFEITNSILSMNTATSDPDYYGTLTPESSNNLIGVDPLFVRDPTPGDPGDLHLLPGSPAINMGSNALAVDAEGNPLTTDLDGKDRVIYGTVDIGAYEYRLTGDANLDAVVDDKDASILGAHWRQQAGATWADGDFNGDEKVDDRDAAILAAHWGEQIEVEALGEGGGTAVASDGPSRGVVGPKAAAASPDARRVIQPRPGEAALRDEPAVARARAARDAAMAEGLGDDEVLACRLAWAYGSVGPRARAAHRTPLAAPSEAMLLPEA